MTYDLSHALEADSTIEYHTREVHRILFRDAPHGDVPDDCTPRDAHDTRYSTRSTHVLCDSRGCVEAFFPPRTHPIFLDICLTDGRDVHDYSDLYDRT